MSIQLAKVKITPKGFTLIEIVFVIAIFAIMSSVVLFQFSNFSARTDQENLAQDIALRIIEAQKTAISGVVSSGLLGTSGTTAPSYGVAFSSDVPSGAYKKFIYFADNNHNSYYDDATTTGCGTAGHECLAVTSINTGDYVSKICYRFRMAGLGSSPTSCGVNTANIVFTRPWPAPVISGYFSTFPLATPPTSTVERLYVEITSSKDPTLQKTLIINNLGEVRVFDGCYTKAFNPSLTTCS
jgi:prepilin-type N-terminal cleavage/methylation domain-containing protein